MEPTMPQTQPYTPIDLTPDQLKRQAELRSAASTPSGIMRQPLSDKQLLNYAQEEIAARELAKQALENKSIQDTTTQDELVKLGLKAPQVKPTALPVGTGTVDESQVVSRQSPQAQGLEAGRMPSQAMPGTPEYEKLVLSSLAQQQSAADKSLQATDFLMKEYELNQQRRAQNEFDALSEVKKKISEVDDQTKNFEWDNRSIWEKSSTGQKIALAIGGFLSSLSDSGAKAFRESVVNSMQRDLDQQKEKYNLLKEQKKDYQSFYGDLVKKFGDEKTADLQMMNLKYNMINNKLKIMSETAQSKMVAAKALQGIDLVNSEIAKNQAAMIAQMTALKNSSPGKYGAIKDEAAKRRLTESKDATDVATSSIEELIKIGKAGRAPFSESAASYDILVEKLAAEIAKANAGGKPSDVEIENAKKMIPSKYSPFFEKSLLALKNRLNQDLKIKEKNLGVVPAGEGIGRIK